MGTVKGGSLTVSSLALKLLWHNHEKRTATGCDAGDVGVLCIVA